MEMQPYRSTSRLVSDSQLCQLARVPDFQLQFAPLARPISDTHIRVARHPSCRKDRKVPEWQADMTLQRRVIDGQRLKSPGC